MANYYLNSLIFKQRERELLARQQLHLLVKEQQRNTRWYIFLILVGVKL